MNVMYKVNSDNSVSVFVRLIYPMRGEQGQRVFGWYRTMRRFIIKTIPGGFSIVGNTPFADRYIEERYNCGNLILPDNWLRAYAGQMIRDVEDVPYEIY